jgi:hypothetical protein
VSGVGTVTCPKPVVSKGQTSSVLGILFFANAADIGGQPFTNPVVDVQIFTPKWNNGYASAYVWNTEPSTWYSPLVEVDVRRL